MLTVRAVSMHFPHECKRQESKASICPGHHCVPGTWGSDPALEQTCDTVYVELSRLFPPFPFLCPFFRSGPWGSPSLARLAYTEKGGEQCLKWGCSPLPRLPPPPPLSEGNCPGRSGALPVPWAHGPSSWAGEGGHLPSWSSPCACMKLGVQISSVQWWSWAAIHIWSP